MKSSLYKIIHTTCHTGWGQLEKRILNESLWMADKGHQMIIVAPEGTPLFKRAKGFGFRLYPMTFRRLAAIANYKSLIRIFENEQPQILNTHGDADSKIALAAGRKTNIPLRILSRHISAHVRNSWHNRRLHKKLSHYTFTTADYTRHHLQKVFKLSDMEIFSIPSGIIEPTYLPPKEEARQTLANELGLDLSTRFMGFAGKVSQNKGVDILLKGFAKAMPHIPHHLAIAGKGEPAFQEHLSGLSRDLGIDGRVHFLGFKEDIWPFYPALDCHILASRDHDSIVFEGIPQALLEAMYAACPVIGSRTQGITDIIIPDETGLLFEAGDVNGLCGMIISTLNDEAATLERVKTARENVKKHHTIDAMGRDISRIYRLHQVKLEKQFIRYPD